MFQLLRSGLNCNGESMQTSIAMILRRAHLGGILCLLFSAQLQLLAADPPELHRGYYTSPALHGDTIVFTSEGDLWTVSTRGGVAHRLTSNSGAESGASISPDGKTVAFDANFEGPGEVYTMPIEGGLPQRRTWDGEVA